MIETVKSIFERSKWNLAQKLEIEWWKQYLKKKDINSYLNWKKKYWKDLLHEIESEIVFEKNIILDVGCGPAGIYMIFQNSQVLAVDPLINAYKKNVPHFMPNEYPWVNFYSIKCENFKTETKVDTIFCLNAINHFTNINISLSAMDENLKHGGYCVLTIDTHRRNWTKKIFSRIPADALHPHQYTLTQYIYKIKESCPCWNLVYSKKIKSGLIFNYDLLVFQK